MIRGLAAHRAVIIQFIKFGTVGFFGFFVDYAFFHLAFDQFGLGHYGSALSEAFKPRGHRHGSLIFFATPKCF